MSRGLEGKVAIVTGVSTGIKEAIAPKLAKEGAKVFVNGIVSDPLNEVTEATKQYGWEAIAHTGDISQEFPAQDCIQIVIDTWGEKVRKRTEFNNYQLTRFFV